MRKLMNDQNPMFCQWPDHEFSSELKKLSDVLFELPEATQLVFEDLTTNAKHRTGANGMTAEQVLRAAIVKQQNQWTYDELAVNLADSAMTRAFVMLDFEETYRASCLQATISRIRGKTWEKINALVLTYAKNHGVENGRRIRMDSTVVDADIHPPSDSQLLYDCIKVANRALTHLRKAFRKPWYTGTKDTKAKGLVLAIINSKGMEKKKSLYRKLLKEASRTQSEVKRLVHMIPCKPGMGRYLDDLRKVSELLPAIIDQTRRRVLRNEAVPSCEKIVSIFEPHTDVIIKGFREVEYGHKLFLSAGTSGMVTACQLVQGNPHDVVYYMDMIHKHRDVYGTPPRQVSADGGFASIDNVDEAKEAGVKDVCFSKTLGIPIEEMCRNGWVFQRLRKFRAGIEGVISVLKRAFGLERCSWRGVQRFASYVHSNVCAYNMSILARQLT